MDAPLLAALNAKATPRRGVAPDPTALAAGHSGANGDLCPQAGGAALGVTDEAPRDAAETVQRWASELGVRPGRFLALTASGAASLVTRWALARAWPPVTTRQAAAALRALGVPRHRRGAYRISSATLARRLAAEAAQALQEEGVTPGDGRAGGAPRG